MKSLIGYLDVQGINYSMMFTSDHGEIVNVGHGVLRGGVDQYMVPLFVKRSKDAGNICDFIGILRNKNGYISGLGNKFILLKLLGFDVDREYVVQQTADDRILHSDGVVYQWDVFLNRAINEVGRNRGASIK